MNENQILKLILLFTSCYFANGQYSVLQDLGCWKDDPNAPAIDEIPNLILPLFLNSTDAIKNCANKAKMLGFSFIGVRGDYCGSSSNADVKYMKYGPSYDCNANGTGGANAIQVYEIDVIIDVQYRKIGCFKESDHNSIPEIEKRFIDLHDPPHYRDDALGKCARSAEALGHRMFALRASGLCSSSEHARVIINSYNESCADNSGFSGDNLAYNKSHVYELTVGKKIRIKYSGCYEMKPSTKSTTLLLLETFSNVLPKPIATRDYKLERCARYAVGLGGKAIGIGVKGQACTTSSTGAIEYMHYSPLRDCSAKQARHVYPLYIKYTDYHSDGYELRVNDYRSTDMGCWSNEDGILPEIETYIFLLNHDLGRTKDHFFQRCAYSAERMGIETFGLIDGGRCVGSVDVSLYNKLKPSTKCPEEGHGGKNDINMYKANTVYLPPQVRGLGCYSDRKEHAIESLESTSSLLDEHPMGRKNAIMKCASVAAMNGYKVFAIQNGYCHSSEDAHHNYKKYGKAICSARGKGFNFINQVYEITNSKKFKYRNLGCWKTDSFQTIPIAEGLSLELSDDPTRRENSLEKCAIYAYTVGNTFFALQNSGICTTGSNEMAEYDRIGRSELCLRDGLGGLWSNQDEFIDVYELPVSFTHRECAPQNTGYGNLN